MAYAALKGRPSTVMHAFVSFRSLRSRALPQNLVLGSESSWGILRECPPERNVSARETGGLVESKDPYSP